MSVRQVQRAAPRYGNADQVRALFKQAPDAGYGEVIERGPSQKGGRPGQVFRLNLLTNTLETGSPVDEPPAGGPETGFVNVGARSDSEDETAR